MKKLNIFQRLRFAWLAFKYANKAMYGIIIAQEVSTDAVYMMPSDIDRALKCVTLQYIDKKTGTETSKRLGIL